MQPTRRVRGAGVDLAVYERGPAEAPTVVLIHGFPDSASMWDPVADVLADRFRVVAYDVRGTGASDRPRRSSGYRLDLLEADLAAVVDAVSPGRAVHLVGHDWGSIQGWHAVTGERLRDRIASYTSLSGPCLDHIGHWARTNTPSRATLTQGLRSTYVGFFHVPVVSTLLWRAFAPRWRDVLERRFHAATDDAWPAPTVAGDGSAAMLLYRANIGPRVGNPRERRTDVPVQQLVAVDDPAVTPPMAESCRPWASRLWVRRVTGNHWLPRSRPDRFARWVGELVEHVEGGDESPGLRRARAAEGRYDGSVVVVTGAGSGIGRATALAFAERGASIVAVDIDGDAAAVTAGRCAVAAGPDASCTSFVADVGDLDALERLAKSIERDFGAPDVVVNNAGIGMAGPQLSTSADDWERVIRINLLGVVHGSRLLGALQVARGEGGHIVNVSSASAFVPSRILPAYATAKAGVLMATLSLRAELAREGIGVHAIAPGLVDTGIVERTRYVDAADDDDRARRVARATALYKRRRLGAERVADAILRAVEDDLDVVPVGAEAHVLRALGRFAPGLTGRLARRDLFG